MKKSIIGKIITVIVVVSTTVMIGMTLGLYMLSNIDFDKFNSNPMIEIVK